MAERKWGIYKTKTFKGSFVERVEKEANDWMQENDVRIISLNSAIDYNSDYGFIITILYQN